MTENPATRQSLLASHALLSGITLLSLVTTHLVAASALLLLGHTQLEYSLIIALLLTMGVCWMGVSRLFLKHRTLWLLLHMTLCGAVLFGAVTLTSTWLDTSIDGQTYHADGIIALEQGWNPYRTNEPVDAVYPLWTGFFSKGPWINAASLYRLTGTIEAGKAFQIVLLVASLALAWHVFATQPGLPGHHAAALSLLLALNPVTICQLFTFYVDGQLASCLVILVCLLWLLERSFDPFVLFATCLVSLLIINLKLNGGIYVGVLVVGSLAWLWIKRRPERMQATLWLFATGVFAVLVVGYNPFITHYVTRFLATGNPFYPTQWAALIRIDANTPVDLLGKDRFTRLGLSLFSQSQVSIKASTLKIPFTVFPEEFLNFRFPDTRLGGFGPLFSGILLLALSGGGVALWPLRRSLKQMTFPIFLLLLLAVSILSSNQGWWARYAPQLWMIPIIIAVLILSTTQRLWLQRVTIAMMLVIFVNVALIAVISLWLGLVDQHAVREDLALLRTQSLEKPFDVNFNDTPMTQWRFDHEGIAYHRVDELPRCADDETLRNVVYSLSIVCNRK